MFNPGLTIIFIILILLVNTVFILNVINYVTMFQQNSYYVKNYHTWIKANLYKIVPNYFLFIIMLSVFWWLNNDVINIILALICVIIFCFVIWFKIKLTKLKQRINLNYTPRIKRLLTTLLMLVVIIITIINLYVDHNLNVLLLTTIFCVSILSITLPWWIIIANFVNTPIENAIKKYYFNDAKAKRANYSGDVVAITGSFGKTTTKNFVHTILSEHKFVYQTPASFNSTMGLTIAIRRDLKPIHDVFLAELGAKKNNDLDDVMELTNPNIAILSSIGPQHLETFKSLKNIINTKFSIVEQLQNGGIAFLNYDDQNIANYKIKNKNVTIFTYGINNNKVDYHLKNIMQTSKGTSFDIYFHNEKLNDKPFTTKVLGRLNLLNICVGVALAHQKKIPMRKIMLGVLKISAPQHRLELKNNGNYIMIDDAYNSNPVGSKEALKVLGSFNGRKIVVTPGMIELGSEQQKLNKAFGTYMNGNCDYVILVGNKISKDIKEGLIESGFDMNDVYNVNHINEAFSLLNKLCQKDQDNYVLFENDLPDVYM